MAPQENTNVHLEAMEITEDAGEEPDEAWNARMESVSKRKHTKRILGYCREWYIAPHHNK